MRVSLHTEGVDLNWKLALWATSRETSPSTRREWIEIQFYQNVRNRIQSPSTRREWIEIFVNLTVNFAFLVSLHTEGVD